MEQPGLDETCDQSGDGLRSNEDLFATLTLEECEKLLDEYCEPNIDQLAAIKESERKLLLKSCNDLLTRLDNPAYNQLAGRVLVFLARTLPFFDPSGTNFKGEFRLRGLPQSVDRSLSQITAQTRDRERSLSQNADHDMEEGETISEDESNDSLTIDDSAKVYEKFWRTQAFLREPTQLLMKDNYFAFRAHVDTMLSKLKSIKTKQQVWNLKGPYMTDPRTLSVQMTDVNMRRCFLVQILIILQFLESQIIPKNSNFVNEAVLTSWSMPTRDRIHQMLSALPNKEDGDRFSLFVQQVLRREEMWLKWKEDTRCQAPKKPTGEDDIIAMRGTYFKRRKISDEARVAKASGQALIGSPSMTRLWNMRPVTQTNLPSLDKYLNVPEEKRNESFKDPNYSFTVLRLLRRSPHFFGQASANIQTLDGYLKSATARYFN